MSSFYSKLTKVNLLVILLVIIAGSVVRATHSGMGCPDWPTCYGMIIPPTSIDQLPDNYKVLYANEGIPAEDFSAVKTWTEYINRLLGAILGITVLIQFITSFSQWKSNKKYVALSFLILLFTGFQGWLGALVVSSNLAPIRITIHMTMAMVILLLATHCAYSKDVEAFKNPLIKNTILLSLIMMFLQIVLGTQVREEIDVLAKAFPRDIWISNTTILFKIHRSYSIAILLVNGFLLLKMYQLKELWKKSKNYLIPLAISLLISAFSGIIMAYLAVPASMQPVHLLFGSIILLLLYRLKLLVQ